MSKKAELSLFFLHQKEAKTKNEDLPKKAAYGSLGHVKTQEPKKLGKSS